MENDMSIMQPVRKPCPKCGGTSSIVLYSHPGTTYVQHDDNHCWHKGKEVAIFSGMDRAEMERKAIEYWNESPQNIDKNR